MSSKDFLEVAKVAMLSDQHKGVLTICHSEEKITVSYNVATIESLELARLLNCLLKSALVCVDLCYELLAIRYSLH